MSNRSTDEQWAIATGAMEPPGQENKPSALSKNSATGDGETAAPKNEAPDEMQQPETTSQDFSTRAKLVSETQTATIETEDTVSRQSASASKASEDKDNPEEPPKSNSQDKSGKTERNSSESIGTTSSANSGKNNSAAQSNNLSSNAQPSTSKTSVAKLETEVLTPPAENDNSSLVLDGSSNDTAITDEGGQILEILLPKNDLTTAQQLESPEFESSGALAPDTANLYQFSVEETGIFTATLSNLSADADVQLIQDKNANGQVDEGEIVAWEWEKGTTEESIRHFLEKGDYVLRVLDQGISPAPLVLDQADIDPEPTDYSITTTFKAAETDDRAFSINVVYQQGVEQLNEQAQEAIEQAADYWEDVISYSSFDRPLELALGIYGTNTVNSFLAYAGPYSYRNTASETDDENTEDKLLPVVGFAVLNNRYLDQYNSNPDYLESVLRHEIGHVLGLGIIWDQRGNDLVDQDTGVYRAETYAGLSYGDLLGTGIATEIPLDQESLTHWDEDIFDTELLTPRAEGIGEPLPLSQLTISSLRDLGWNVNYGAAEAFSLGSSGAIA